MTPKLWVPTLSSGCVSPRFLQAPQIQHIPNPWGHLTLPSSPNLLPQCALGWYNLIISASPKLWTHLSGQPSANLRPHFISNQVLPVLLLKDSSNCPWLSLSLCDLCPRPQLHPIHLVSLPPNASSQITTLPHHLPLIKMFRDLFLLKCPGFYHDSRASWSGPGPSLWLISLIALCFLAALECYNVAFQVHIWAPMIPRTCEAFLPFNSDLVTCPPGRLAGSSSLSKWIRSPSPERLCLLCRKSSHLLQNVVIRCFPP